MGTEDEDEDVHITTTRSLNSRDGVRIHRATRIERSDLFRPRHFVITSVPRTIVDLADVLPGSEHRARIDDLPGLAIDRARDVGAQPLPFRVAPRPPLIAADEPHTKSELERRYRTFSRTHDIELPAGTNARVAGHKADCRDAEAGVVVELDGRAFHQRRAQMRADRRRNRPAGPEMLAVGRARPRLAVR